MRTRDPEAIWRTEEFKRYRVAGLLALQRGDLGTAIREHLAGAEAARDRGDLVCQGRFLANLSTAYLLQRENRKAVQTLLLAREAATAAGDLSTMQTVEANLANLYVQAGDYEAAAAAAERGAVIHPPAQVAEVRIPVLLSFGRAIAKTRGLAAAEPLFQECLLEAATAGSSEQDAEILDLWGYEALERQEYGIAEELLARAWFRRVVTTDPRAAITAAKLGKLYRKMGKYAAARRWMDRVRESTADGRKIPVVEWSIAAEQGHVYAGEERLREALASYREALEWAKQWRRELPPADRLRMSAEQRMLELFEGYLRAAGKLYRQHPDPELSAEMFTLIQTTRAWSMETSADGEMPDGTLYARARRLEGQWLAGVPGAAGELKGLRASILERESARTDGMKAAPASRLEAPGEDEAVLTYWLDEDQSWLWVWTKKGLQVTSLPARAQVLREAECFRDAVASNAVDARVQGERVMGTLLGNLRMECLRAKRWEIVADAGLFQTPFAALPAGNGAFLAEQIEIRLIPNALRHETGESLSRRFLAVADPIFNAADERQPKPWLFRISWFRPLMAPALPRLPGTRREAESAASIWRKAGFATAIQLGATSSEEEVVARLRDWQPGIVHIATHTVTPADDAARPRLALSLRGDGSPGLLAAEDIAALRVRAELVVLSACHSAGGEPAKGSGLLGLTRAWLTAGSRQVVATLWPVGDESTAFFLAFYERLAGGVTEAPLPVASALRQAQLACIRGGGVAAQPRNWAGHVLLARR